MNKSKSNEHPEIVDIKNICDVSPDTEDTQAVCEKINENNTQAKVKALRVKKDKKLDKDLKETFPASDAITKY